MNIFGNKKKLSTDICNIDELWKYYAKQKKPLTKHHIQLLFRHLVMSDSAAPWTAASQASMSLTISQSLPKFVSTALVIPSGHLILCHPLLLLPFPTSESFPVSPLFTWGGQSVGTSASVSVILMSFQDWFHIQYDSPNTK